MRKTSGEVAGLINGELVGNKDIVITGINSIEEAREGDLTFADNPKHLRFIEKTQASCVITPNSVKESSKTIIRTENPSLAFAKILSLVHPQGAKHPCGIHPTAIIEKNVNIGKDVSVGAYSVISVGTTIGDNAIIYPGVIIREGTIIGNRVIIHSGSVIGTDGFGYRQIGGKHIKIPQVGKVVIEDDVEIGSCVTIDRATLGKTVIGHGTKIDNLVQIAHNVKVGANCIIVAQVGISGSSSLGANVMLGGQVGLTDHVSLGDRVMVGAKAGVSKSYPAGSIILGIPAKPYSEQKRIFAASARLPRLVKKVSELEKKIAELEKKISG